MKPRTTALRRLLHKEPFVYVPVAYDALGARLVEKMGFKAVYTGGFVTGSSRCTSEPLLTMDEQVRVAGDVANAVRIPALADGGAGFGDPLHTMRSVREFVRAGVAGIHIEDQLYPKRAHYHRAKGHTTTRKEFIDKIRFACLQRDQSDKDFLVIARTETCRSEGLDEAARRINAAADVGADMGLLFPRNDDEMKRAPKKSRIPLVYVLSRGNRDGRPVPTAAQLADIGYKAAIDAVTYLLVSFYFAKQAYGEIERTGNYSGLAIQDWIDVRKEIEDIVGLDDFYRIEEATVEKGTRRKR
ncbi:MAG: isocitrate lyase/PEP mutase family protein [Gemmatimonadetes bacterium]|nr:isocitrate lyase/PEP mutase family protein [Gemmatimonadota bacterium]